MRSADALAGPKAIGLDVGAIVGLAGDEHDDANPDAVVTDPLCPSVLENGVPVEFCGTPFVPVGSLVETKAANRWTSDWPLGPVAVGIEMSGRRRTHGVTGRRRLLHTDYLRRDDQR